MKVKDLIAILQDRDPEADVHIFAEDQPDYAYYEVSGVEGYVNSSGVILKCGEFTSGSGSEVITERKYTRF